MLSHHLNLIGLLYTSLIFGACSTQKELTQVIYHTQEQLVECRVDVKRARDEVQRLSANRDQLKASLSERENKLKAARDQVKHTQKETMIVNDLSQRQLALLARSVGAEVSLRDQVRIVAQFGDLKSFFVYSAKNHVLMAHARFSGFTIELDAINEWNRTRRFRRVYLDKDRDVVLEAEIDLEPGVRLKVIQAWIKNFGLVLNLFHYTLRQGTLRGHPMEGRRGSKRERI